MFGNVIELLVRKWEKDINFLTVVKTAFNSALVESAAMKDWMFVLHEMTVPFRRLQLDCIVCWSGGIFPNDESQKYTNDDGRKYCNDCDGENVNVILRGSPIAFKNIGSCEWVCKQRIRCSS